MLIYGIALLRPWHFEQKQATWKEDLLTVNGRLISKSNYSV